MSYERLKPKAYLIWMNAAGFLLVILINYLANSLPINGLMTGQISDFYPNLFVPAGRTFAIWGIIYLLMAGFVIYPFLYSGEERQNIYQQGWYFLVSCLANVGWLLCWHYRFMSGAFVFMIMLLLSLVQIYLLLRRRPYPYRWPEKVWIYTFISIYLGWICVATIANTTAFLVHVQWSGWGLSPEWWTILMLVVATLLGGWFLWRFQDFAVVAVILWALYGIYSRQATPGGSTTVVYGALALMIGLILSTLTLYYRQQIIKKQ